MQESLNLLLAALRASARFKWLIVAFAWGLSLFGWAYVYQLGEVYQARARVFVDTNRILQPLLRGIAVQPDVTERVSMLSRTLLNRPNLERLARMTDLDVEATTDIEKEQLINELGSSISLSATRRNTSVYNLSYRHSDPDIAKRMVQSILTIFVESAIGDERKDSEVTQSFLQSQKEYYESQLVEADSKLADFRRTNFGLLPDDRESSEARLASDREALVIAQQNLAVAESRLEVYQNQLSRQPRYTVTAVPGQATASTIDNQLEELRRELASLSSRYTEKYPLIAQLRSSIADLESQRERVRSERVTQNSSYSREPNPLYEELRTAYTLAEIDVGAMRRQVNDIQASVDRLQDSVDSMPDVAKELNRLLRGNESLLNSYHEILSRIESARIAEQVDQNVDDVNFRVIDPPFVSSTPAGPGKEILSAGVFASAAGLGVALAFVFSLLFPVFYEMTAVEKLTGRPVLGTVSERKSVFERMWSWFNWLSLLVFATLLVLVFLIVELYYLGYLSSERISAIMDSPVGPVIEKISFAVTSILETVRERVGL